jgi:hypothetical protein
MISIQNQGDQEIETRQRHPLDKADNIYFQLNNSPFVGGPIAITLFPSYQRNIPILHEMSDYEVCVAGFNIDISAIASKPDVRRILFLTSRLPVRQEFINSERGVEERILLAYYPSQTELSTSTNLAFNNTLSSNFKDLENSGQLREIDLQIKIEYFNDSQVDLSGAVSRGSSVLLNFRRKQR